MGATFKALLAAGIAAVLLAYMVGLALVDGMVFAKAKSLEDENRLIATQRSLLFARMASLQSANSALSAQLDYELEAAKQRQASVSDSTVVAPATPVVSAVNRGNLQDILDKERARVEAELQAQSLSKLQQLQNLTEINQRLRSTVSSSSGGSSGTSSGGGVSSGGSGGTSSGGGRTTAAS